MRGRPYVRPFVCHGSPLECKVFIVGCNPATELAVDFWRFWHPSFGFDRCEWRSAYKAYRRSLPSQGKRRPSEVSPTRRVIDLIVTEVETGSQVRCLETNIYSTPTKRASDLEIGQQNTDLFQYLLTVIKPSVIVAHGKKAQIAIRESFLQEICASANILDAPHFSRGWSNNRACELGRKVKRQFNYAKRARPD